VTIRGVLFDFGGVLTTSPFESFARYEQANALTAGFLRSLNATNPDTNAWAKLERSEVDVPTFCELYEAEALAAGGTVDAMAVLGCLDGEVRPQMVDAVRRIRIGGLRLGLLTNTNVAHSGDGRLQPIAALFDVVIESSKVGLRKPDPAIYTLACDELGVDPSETVFLDDLGINLKPAAKMGMKTIKVADPDDAVAELEAVVGFTLR